MCIRIFGFSHSEDPRSVYRTCISSNSKVWLALFIRGLLLSRTFSPLQQSRAIQVQCPIPPGHLFSHLLIHPWAWTSSTPLIHQWWGPRELAQFVSSVMYLHLVHLWATTCDEPVSWDPASWTLERKASTGTRLFHRAPSSQAALHTVLPMST